MTGFLLADWLVDQGFRGAAQVIATSASWRTGDALGVHLEGRVHRVGLAAKRNLDFVRAPGAFDEVRADPEADAVAQRPSVLVDMARAAPVMGALRRWLGPLLVAHLAVGITHWQDRTGPDATGPAPEWFFAPAHVAKRDAEWGRGELRRRADAASLALLPRIRRVVAIEERHGAAALRDGGVRLVRGEVPPFTGLVAAF